MPITQISKAFLSFFSNKWILLKWFNKSKSTWENLWWNSGFLRIARMKRHMENFHQRRRHMLVIFAMKALYKEIIRKPNVVKCILLLEHRWIIWKIHILILIIISVIFARKCSKEDYWYIIDLFQILLIKC